MGSATCIRRLYDIMKIPQIAVAFPGQGSQRPGMGMDFFDRFDICRRTYEEASEALGWDVAAVCFGQDERLNMTEFTQPCVVTTEVAMLRCLQQAYGFSPSVFGGHSLGEFTALVAAEALPLAEALRIVQVRGRLMQQAMPVGTGGMAAVISEQLDAELIRNVLVDIPIDIANINSLNQIVISGDAKAMPTAEARLKESIGKDRPFRFVSLNVSAPFHSRFMKPVEAVFADVFQTIGRGLNPEKARQVTSNFTGAFHTGEVEQISSRLAAQISHTVHWKDNMAGLAETADQIFEIGPSRPLREFFKTLSVTCLAITTVSSADRIFAANN